MISIKDNLSASIAPDQQKLERRMELLKQGKSQMASSEEIDKYNNDLKSSMKEFEKIFIKQILHDSRKSYIEANLFAGDAMTRNTKDIVDDNMAEVISQAGGFGVGKFLFEKYKKNQDSENQSSTGEVQNKRNLPYKG